MLFFVRPDVDKVKRTPILVLGGGRRLEHQPR
jgi:hypothetical protein